MSKLIGLGLVCLALTVPGDLSAGGPTPRETRYLAFQIFTGTPDPAVPIGDSALLSPLPSQESIERTVDGILEAIGAKGDKSHRLGFVLGPISMDHGDTDVKRLIKEAFTIARDKDIAVGFHIDDSMFWRRRAQDLRAPADIEWLDWSGRPNTGRRIDWGPQPMKLMPQLCFGSPAVRKAVAEMASVLGGQIAAEFKHLKREGREDLFLGVIAGWETQIGRDFDTGRHLGYCSLAHKGYSAANPPPDLDRAREDVVQEFIGHWGASLVKAGLPAGRIYSHIAFTPKAVSDDMAANDPGFPGASRSQHFAPLRIAFGTGIRPGFSTYPAPALFKELHATLRERNVDGWASCEGTNVDPGNHMREETMETYLARMFNHGAILVNIFAWGVGGEEIKHTNHFRRATEGRESIEAYRKFLRGERLVESTKHVELPALASKVRRIQRELPAWIRRTGRADRAMPLMQKLEKSLKIQDSMGEAEKVADEVLTLIATEGR